MTAKKRLDVDQEAEMREIFSHFDRDSSGFIDGKEFRALCDALGAGMSDAELAEGLKVVDRNRNGRIELKEFMQWWTDR